MNRFVKRSGDLLISGFVTVTVLPVLCLFVKLLQILHSPGPLSYKQKRTGLGDEVFWGQPDPARIALFDATTSYNMHAPVPYAGTGDWSRFIEDRGGV